MMRDYKFLAIQAAREAGVMLRERLHHVHHVEYKGEINLVTEADRISEDMIVSRIRKTFPDHDLQMEESAELNNGSPYCWIIDSLGGTTHYAHGYPVFYVSIALAFEGKVRLGVIYHPMMDELFVAEVGQGATCNGEVIRVSETDGPSRSLLATGFPYDIRHTEQDNIGNFIAMAKRVQAIRRAGSAALDLAYVAAGRFDGFWELKLAPWDTAAGCLMVTEAGGIVTDLYGGHFLLSSPHVLASNGKIHDGLLTILRDVDDQVKSRP